jgi:ribosomal protein L40E
MFFYSFGSGGRFVFVAFLGLTLLYFLWVMLSFRSFRRQRRMLGGWHGECGPDGGSAERYVFDANAIVCRQVNCRARNAPHARYCRFCGGRLA